MVTLLAKLFIKQKPDPENPEARQAYGMLLSAVGILLNAVLCAFKLLAGLISGSIAISADAFNNLSDAGSSAITLASFALSRQKPDHEHPFGHGRMEYIAGLLVAIAILLMGFELLKSSVEKIRSPEPVAFTVLTAVILVVSILIKAYMALYNRWFGKRLGSPAMRATAIDSVSDCVATTVVLLSTLIGHVTDLPLDGWCGLAVACFILFAGYRAVREMISPLLGEPPSQALIERIEATVRACPEVLGMHDLIVHDYGPGRLIISLHAEVSAEGDMLTLHDAIDNIERMLRDTLHCTAVIHMDPVVTDDASVNATKERVQEVVKGLGERVTIHDFRMVPGPTHTNVIFDVVVPYDLNLSEQEIKGRVSHMIRALDGEFYAVVQVDREYK